MARADSSLFERTQRHLGRLAPRGLADHRHPRACCRWTAPPPRPCPL